jgi:hypothetical protein
MHDFDAIRHALELPVGVPILEALAKARKACRLFWKSASLPGSQARAFSLPAPQGLPASALSASSPHISNTNMMPPIQADQ